MLAFDIRYDLYGQGEPRVVLYKPGTMTPGETISLSEAERRGIVSKEQAEPLYRRALAIREKILGPDHPRVALVLENYATLLRQTGREPQAAEMEARATAIRAKHAQENPKK
ncbi:MAG: tetratricopeptide repeat protein [Candidatus Acidoferrales bacterium]